MTQRLRNRQKTYACHIKSFCSAPDLEIEIEADDKKDAVKKLMKHPSLRELDRNDVERNIYCVS